MCLEEGPLLRHLFTRCSKLDNMKNKKNTTNHLQTLAVLGIGFSIFFLITDNRYFIYLVIGLLASGSISTKVGKGIDYVWMKIGEFLGLIVPNIILGVIFYIFLTPIAFLSRLFSKEDQLLLKKTTKTSFKESLKLYNTKYFETPW